MKLKISPLRWLESVLKILLRSLVVLYVKIKHYAPFVPRGTCRFYPTCSSYALTSLEKYRLPIAVYKIIWRLLRCNPFNPGGYDPPA